MKKICEFLNCKEEGIYPAPRSRKDITNYKYYCIEHIRDFNKSWNFFEGLTEEEFENEIRKSTTWDRPSWKFGTSNFNKKINVDVRIISASNNNLAEFIKIGSLREDLFYRLSVAPIEVPPLNKRDEDIADLITHFLNLLAKDFGNVL